MKLRDARKATGLRQCELARRLKVTQSAVANWERGINPPLPKYHSAIARILKVPAGEIDELNEAQSK